MGDWFQVPSAETYSCIQRQSDTTIYAYKSNVRDTYIINGLTWEKTGTQSYTGNLNNIVCVTGYQIPSQVTGFIVLSALLVVGAIFNHIIKMILGVQR